MVSLLLPQNLLLSNLLFDSLFCVRRCRGRFLFAANEINWNTLHIHTHTHKHPKHSVQPQSNRNTDSSLEAILLNHPIHSPREHIFPYIYIYLSQYPIGLYFVYSKSSMRNTTTVPPKMCICEI